MESATAWKNQMPYIIVRAKHLFSRILDTGALKSQGSKSIGQMAPTECRPGYGIVVGRIGSNDLKGLTMLASTMNCGKPGT